MTTSVSAASHLCQPIVLVADDDVGLLRVLARELGSQGFRVVATSSPEEVIPFAKRYSPDLVLLDLVLPGMSGLELMRGVHQWRRVPVFIMSGRAGVEDRIRGLDLGADDYLPKPLHLLELGTRLQAVLRRTRGLESFVVCCDDLVIDLPRRRVLRGERDIVLTATEWAILRLLATRANEVVSTTELLSKVWGPGLASETQLARVWIGRVRKKLERDKGAPAVITTRPGLGYLLEGEVRPVA